MLVPLSLKSLAAAKRIMSVNRLPLPDFKATYVQPETDDFVYERVEQ